jgi:hypothetical protein
MSEKIVMVIKAFLLVFVMFIGFWFGYAFIWFTVGLPQTEWALWICFALALLSEFGYCKWLEMGWY